jgi:cell division protein FtsI/penicillin-binding protein 2
VNSSRRHTSLLATALAGLLAITGCGIFGGGPGAEDEAADVAAALSAGKPSRLTFDGASGAQAQDLWDRAVQGMGGSTAKVTVGTVDEGDAGTAEATLSYAWTLAGSSTPWKYRTKAELTQRQDDSWAVRLSPTLVNPELRSGELLERVTSPADRGDILDARGAPLVTERPVQRFGIDRSTIPAARAVGAARALAAELDIDPEPYVARVRAAGPKAFVEALVLREADARAALRRGATAIDGVTIVRGTLPLAPTREFARPVLGTVGPVTAEIVKASKGVYGAGDEAGLSGLEARYDEQLRGAPGVRVDAVDEGGARRELFSSAPVAGRPLATTLDTRLQRTAESALSDVRPASALVAVRPSTGDLLAVASGPGSKGYSTATVGQYAPGSTFKVVTSLALLRAGVRPGSLLRCPATTAVEGKTFKNYADYPGDGLGPISLSTAVANSCNTAFVNERRTVSQGDLAGAAAALGLGVDHDVGFPAYFGSVPGTLAEAGSATGHAASMIGQGKVLASPMAMAVVAASVARGDTVVPRLLPQQQPDEAGPEAPVTAAEARTLRALMRGVVTRGSGSFLAALPGPPVLAKTGTAEFGTADPLPTHAWMIAVHGDLAVAVFVDVGESGSGTAGPLLEQFLRAAG